MLIEKMDNDKMDEVVTNDITLEYDNVDKIVKKTSNTLTDVIDEIQTNAPNTKYIAEIVKELGLSGKILLLVDSVNENLIKSVRNIPNVNILDVSILNALEALKSKNILITKDAVKQIDKTWGSKASNKKIVKGKV